MTRMDEKTCTKCGETKPLDEFGKHSTGRGGRRPTCRKCHSAESRKRYHASERAAAAKARKAWREQNADALKEERRERVRLKSQKYRDANRVKVNAARRAFYHANPHKGWENQYRLRARRLGLTEVVEDFTKADVIERYGDSCAYCDTGAFEHLDHAIPVNRGGPHTLDNVRPSCAPCNQVKSDKTEAEWLAEQAALDDLTEDELDALIDAEIDRYTQPKEST